MKCRRCNGTGYYMGFGICYGCNGKGVALPKVADVVITPEMVEANRDRIKKEGEARKAARRARRAAKAKAEAAAEKAAAVSGSVV